MRATLPLLPITLNSRPPIRLFVAMLLMAMPPAIAAVMAVGMLPSRVGFEVLFIAGGGALLMFWMIVRGACIRFHPNVLVIDRRGLSISIGGKSDFVGWNEIESSFQSPIGAGWPNAAGVKLTSEALQRRKASNSPLSRGQNFINLSNFWRSGEKVTTDELVKTIEQCRHSFSGAQDPE